MLAAAETSRQPFPRFGSARTLRSPLLLALSVELQQEMTRVLQDKLVAPRLLGALRVVGVAVAAMATEMTEVIAEACIMGVVSG